MTRHRYQQDLFFTRAQKRAHRGKTKPRFAFEVIALPLGQMAPVYLAVALLFIEAAGVHRGKVLVFVNMYLGLGEIRHATGMVEIEMGRNDVAYVAGLKTQRLDLGDRGEAAVPFDIHQGQERGGQALSGFMHIIEAETGIDQDQAVVRFNEKGVADQVGVAAAETLVVQ